MKVRERPLFKDKTAISEDLLALEGELIGLDTESGTQSNNSNLGNVAPAKPVFSPTNSISGPEINDLAATNAELEKTFMESIFANELVKSIPKVFHHQHESLYTSLNWLWPEQIKPSGPAKCFLAGEASTESDSTISA